ncbi:MAG: aminopeptidase P family N-terminal domain-containing protein [Eisenbergiella sp.]
MRGNNMNQLYTDRLARVCSRLREQGLTQMIVSDPLSIGYLTGVWIEPYERLFAFYIRTDGNISSF